MREPVRSSGLMFSSSTAAPAEETSSTRQSRHGWSGSSSKRHFPRQSVNCLGNSLRSSPIGIHLAISCSGDGAKRQHPASRPATRLGGSLIAVRHPRVTSVAILSGTGCRVVANKIGVSRHPPIATPVPGGYRVCPAQDLNGSDREQGDPTALPPVAPLKPTGVLWFAPVGRATPDLDPFPIRISDIGRLRGI
jgi:hypothetical protein